MKMTVNRFNTCLGKEVPTTLKMPVLLAFESCNNTVLAWCPECVKFHRHSNVYVTPSSRTPRKPYRGMLGHRTAHCPADSLAPSTSVA